MTIDQYMARALFLVSLAASVGCAGARSATRPSAAPVQPASDTATPAAVEQPDDRSRLVYEAPKFWLIDEFGVGWRIEDAARDAVNRDRGESPSDVILLLYSSWCPKVDKRLADVVPKLRQLFPKSLVLGVFSDDEFGMLLEEADARKFSEAVRESLRARRESGVGVMPEALVDGRFGIAKYRMPRAQWEQLGGESGDLAVACHVGGEFQPCDPLVKRTAVPTLSEILRDLSKQLDDLEKSK
ncbi:hypothetical protein BE04_12795 [Sorangium cellulosum]|uniref:Thioredoxin domain-containing protein n=1 Tax=Sorangium cellulosum TaxID=56 RepID=A0A150PV14_SORCE|nr:hypothetical protein BE04_12795 [Sorangium cellulosum]